MNPTKQIRSMFLNIKLVSVAEQVYVNHIRLQTLLLVSGCSAFNKLHNPDALVSINQ